MTPEFHEDFGHLKEALIWLKKLPPGSPSGPECQPAAGPLQKFIDEIEKLASQASETIGDLREIVQPAKDVRKPSFVELGTWAAGLGGVPMHQGHKLCAHSGLAGKAGADVAAFFAKWTEKDEKDVFLLKSLIKCALVEGSNFPTKLVAGLNHLIEKMTHISPVPVPLHLPPGVKSPPPYYWPSTYVSSSSSGSASSSTWPPP